MPYLFVALVAGFAPGMLIGALVYRECVRAIRGER